MLRNVLYLVLILLIVVSASAVSSCLWAGKQALQPENIALTAGEGMTAAEFGKKYDLSRQVLKKVFNLTSQDDFKKPVADFGMNEEMLNKRVNQAQAIQAEHESRNWFKIPLKGPLWVIFLLAVFNLYKERQNYRPESKMDLYGCGLCIRHNSWKRSEPDGNGQGCDCPIGFEGHDFSPAAYRVRHLSSDGHSGQQIHLLVGLPVRNAAGFNALRQQHEWV